MNTINRYKYEYIELKARSLRSDDIYNSFLKWMHEYIEKNKQEVIEKDLKYLKQPYEYEEHKILLRIESNNNWYKLIRLNKQSTEKLKIATDDMKEIHDFFDNEESEEKGYKHYNRLLSWYTITPKNIDKIIYNLTRKQEEKENIKYKIESEIKLFGETTLEFINKN